MLAFEIYLNGKKIRTAGIGEPGVLTAILTWVRGEQPRAKDDLRLRVGGLVGRTNTHFTWVERPIVAGDDVRIKVVEAAKVDTPRKRERESPAQKASRQRAYVRRMARQFGWKIQG